MPNGKAIGVAEEVNNYLGGTIPGVSLFVQYDNTDEIDLYLLSLAWQGKEFFSFRYWGNRDQFSACEYKTTDETSWHVAREFSADALMPFIVGSLQAALKKESDRLGALILKIKCGK